MISTTACRSSGAAPFTPLYRIVAAGFVAAAPLHPATAASDTVPTVGTVASAIISPGAPGFDALGVASSQITHPETLKKLAVGLFNGLDPSGNFQNGVAIQFSPARLFAPGYANFDDYLNNPVVRLLTRFEVAAAVAKGGSSDDKSAKATVGFVWRLLDTTDPYSSTELDDCVTGKFASADYKMGGANMEPSAAKSPEGVFTPTSPGDAKPLVEKKQQIAKAYDAEATKCLTTAAKQLARGYSVQVGFAPLFVSDTGKTGDLKGQGFASSAVFALGLGNLFGKKPTEMTADNKLILGMTYRRHENVADPNNAGQFLRRNRLNLGGRLILGAFDDIIFGAEAAYQHATYGGAGKDDYVTYAATIDLKIAEKLWLGGSLGSSSGQRYIGNNVAAGLNLKWSFVDTPTIGK